MLIGFLSLITQDNLSVSGFYSFMFYVCLGISLLACIIFFILTSINEKREEKDKKVTLGQVISALASIFSFFFACYDFYINSGVEYFISSCSVCSTQTTSSVTTISTTTTTRSSEPVTLSIGEKYSLGSYPQSTHADESIQWRVIDVRGDKALLISEKVLDSVLYGKENSSSVTWENSNLRQWLNTDFYNETFSDAEKLRTNGGSTTADKVFVLSTEEAEKYFYSDSDRMAAATDYAKSRGSYTHKNHKLPNGDLTSWYWLRTPGETSKKAARVFNSGEIDYKGFPVGYSKVSVRPAIWIYM